ELGRIGDDVFDLFQALEQVELAILHEEVRDRHDAEDEVLPLGFPAVLLADGITDDRRDLLGAGEVQVDEAIAVDREFVTEGRHPVVVDPLHEMELLHAVQATVAREIRIAWTAWRSSISCK